MFENMYDTSPAYQDPFAGMTPADKATAQQNDIQLGGNGNGQALLAHRGELTPGSGNFNQAAYDELYGNKGQGGTDYGWAGNMINSGLRSFAKDPIGALTSIDPADQIENYLTGGISGKVKDMVRAIPTSLGNMFSTADNPDGVNGAPDVTWQSNIPAPPGRLTPRVAPTATPAAIPPPPPPPQPRLREAPQRATYGMNVGGWGFDGSKPGSQFQTSRNGSSWQLQGGNVAPGSAPPTAGWQQQSGTDTAPGDWTKPPGVK